MNLDREIEKAQKLYNDILLKLKEAELKLKKLWDKRYNRD